MMNRRWLLALTTLCSACGGPDDSPEDDEPTGALASAPYVAQSTPELRANDVYPAPFGDGRGEEVKLSLSFSAPMLQQSDLSLQGGGAVLEPLVKWSENREELELVVRPAFSGRRPLADETEYTLDLTPLTDDAGARLAPDRGLDGQLLVFTTGRYDGLLNHSCGHTLFGPFADVAASPEPGASAPNVATTHTQYSVLLRGDGGDDEEWSGWVRARFVQGVPYRFYFDREVSVTLRESSDAEPQALAPNPVPAACPGITHEVTLSPGADDEWLFLLESRGGELLRMIVEHVPP